MPIFGADPNREAAGGQGGTSPPRGGIVRSNFVGSGSMTIGRVASFCLATLLLAACETTGVEDGDSPVGVRREPCGGGPVFPPPSEGADDSADKEPR